MRSNLKFKPRKPIHLLFFPLRMFSTIEARKKNKLKFSVSPNGQGTCYKLNTYAVQVSAGDAY